MHLTSLRRKRALPWLLIGSSDALGREVLEEASIQYKKLLYKTRLRTERLQDMKRARAPLQCAGVTKANRQCAITTESMVVSESGCLACEPLRRGGRFCLFHAQIFHSSPVQLPPDTMIFYLESHSSVVVGVEGVYE